MDEKSKKDKGKDLTVASQDTDIFARFDALDDKVIIDELETRVIDKWVYHFKSGGREVWGLGKAGIDGCARELSKKGTALREEDVKVQIDPTNAQYVLFTARVAKHFVDKQGEEAMVESAIGTKRQWIMQLIKGQQKPIPDPFWYEKGSIKALRNAKARLIPEELKAQIITFAKKEGKVREIKDNGIATRKKSALKTKREPGDLATAEQKVKIARLENILVDKWGDDPGDLLSKMKNEIGADTEIENLTGAEADEWTNLLEIRIKNKERKDAERIARETA